MTRKRRASARKPKVKGRLRAPAGPAPPTGSDVDYDDTLPGSLFFESDEPTTSDAEGAVDDAATMDPEGDVVDEPAETACRRR